jgi:ParB-like chromosome segregation protein Spo0J
MTNSLAVQILDLASLIPHAKNAKKHSDEQVANIAALIKRLGWTSPIVVDKDLVIIAGHGRRLAALHLGMTKVPVIVRDDLSKEEAEALRLADNRVASTDYDLALEQEALQALAEFNLDLDFSVMGYTERELDFMTNDLGAMDESLFVEDISEAVQGQKEDNEKKVEEVDDIAAPVADALGFKRVTIAESRVLRDLMGRMEQATGLQGAPALIGFIQSSLDRAA